MRHIRTLYRFTLWSIVITLLLMGTWACGGGSSPTNRTPVESTSEPRGEVPEATSEPADDGLDATSQPADDELDATSQPADDELDATSQPADDGLDATSQPGGSENGSALDEVLDQIASDPAFSSSQADQQLRKDTLRMIVTNDAQNGCALLVNGVQVTEQANADGVWVESWEMTVCDQKYTYTITFTPSAGGGTDFQVTR